MSIIFLTEQLNNMENPKRENRQRVADIVLENQNLFKDLVTIAFKVDDRISIKAAWILEWICTHHHLNWIIPHLDEFTKNISNVIFDSATRPCAKICEHLANAYYSKTTNEIKVSLTENHINKIIETGFDWLITPQKIAVRAYTMNTLYLFGLENDWVHPELKHLIETKIIHESKGCKARGKYILNLIDKKSRH
ncbi:adenylosuccinate lyase [Polaribacter vadi]|uniref:adenylosuccinate lyase n=1 Tax=Polaribacter TaxID=52959 RepID=UPI001C099564|nr:MULTISPECIES: adenylosuccinate lyase [Polaribacter]MBU3012008.1 adenylosuccinate lyase [Polaribacter vadi]MDO6741823.1 adenylosuccinate lyase [Polaribacter sp. 1_MG-2023]